MSNKLTLIIDGNWLLMSRLSVLKNKYADINDLVNGALTLMIKSIRIVVNTFKDIDGIVMVVDGGSWRKHIDISDIVDNLKKISDIDFVGYKETRMHDDSLDWDYIFSRFDEFQDLLGQNNVTISRLQYVEGDDWCWFWSTRLNNNGINTIIWSKDNDLKQLVNNDANGCFTVWWNKENGVYIKDTEEDEMNWFFNLEYSENKKILNNIIKKSTKVTAINPHDIVIDKIFRGDASDNIIPLLLRNSKNMSSDKKFKISSKDLNYDININDNETVKKYLSDLLQNKSYINRVIVNDIDFIMKHFKYNKKMVWLDECEYSDEMLEQMNEQFIINKSTNILEDLENVEGIIQSHENNVDDILESV